MTVLRTLILTPGMSRSARSLHYFALCYLIPTAIILLAVPELPFSLLGLPVEGLMWVRIIGMLVCVFTYYYMNLARAEITRFFRWTVHTRALVPLFFAVFVVQGMNPILFLFAFGDFFGAVWTAWALRSEGHTLC